MAFSVLALCTLPFPVSCVPPSLAIPPHSHLAPFAPRPIRTPPRRAVSQAPMPKAKIQETLEVEILPRFAQCFTQLQEATAPGGAAMDDWLKEVTMEMQGSIEKHLSKVFHE
eukprot:2120492-Prymnesium_polylepis.1